MNDKKRKIGWGGRIRTCAWRYQKPLPYRLATPQHLKTVIKLFWVYAQSGCLSVRRRCLNTVKRKMVPQPGFEPGA